MKNHISFVNDHSGSMYVLAAAACKDFNANIKAIKDAASREMLDTIVSVAELGYNTDLTVTASNPHVLKEKTFWAASGGTPLWSTTIKLLDMLKAMPDANKPDVSFLVMMTTDGDATDSDYFSVLQRMMQPLLATGRWTFVARVPKGISRVAKDQLTQLGIPSGNIQEWETTAAGMAASTQATTQAMDGYFKARASGAKSTGGFYADASNVNLAALEELPKKDYSLYVVPTDDNGIEIRPFILRHRQQHLYGSAFYQLTKTESRVQYDKQVFVRDRATGKVFGGKDSRKMIGLPDDRNARLHPGDHKNFDIFIQSNSINRKLVGGTGVLYVEKLGRPFTEADTAYLNPKPTPAPAVTQLPAVPVSTTPTKSPIPVSKKAPAMHYFETRDEARFFCRNEGRPQTDIQGPFKDAVKHKRWQVASK